MLSGLLESVKKERLMRIAWVIRLVFGVTIAAICIFLKMDFIHGTSAVKAQSNYTVWLPLVMKNYPPPHSSTSRYMQTTAPSDLDNMGCSEGQATPQYADIVVILDFGQPWKEGNLYGTIIFGSYTFRSVSQIEEAAKSYIDGFYRCAPSNTHLTLAVGTNNYGPWVVREHGEVWAQLVKDLETWIDYRLGYSGRFVARGADDIEPSFKDVTSTRAWVEGFRDVSGLIALYYNYGSCDGCPYSGCPSCVPANGWTVEDVWYVSWGATPAFPIPEIYLTNAINADQWHRIAVYGYENHNQTLVDFKGTLTQWQACQTTGNCQETDNRPEEGWAQLIDALNSDPRTIQYIRWSTDITWE